MDGGIEFDWDAENRQHLERHRVTPGEFEELMQDDPLCLEYQAENDEERYKVLGATSGGRILIGVWTPRAGKIRAITAYAAGPLYRKLYLESRL
jgi:uncharacterized DUF497 family protein